MAAQTSCHRYGTKLGLRHCYHMYSAHRATVTQFRSVYVTACFRRHVVGKKILEMFATVI